MMSDDMINELWGTKDAIAREHGYDVEEFVAYLRAKKRPKDQKVVDLRAEKDSAGHRASTDAAKLEE